MTAELISGKEVAQAKRQDLKQQAAALKEKGIVPGLVVLLVGENPASLSYVKGKVKACEEVGIYSELKRYPETITEEALLKEIEHYNKADHIDGILVQLPLPDHISEHKVIDTISPEKDVDGFHPINVGRMVTGQDAFLSCTPYGIVEMIKYKNIPISGKHVVIVGRSNIVGKPASLLFLRENATVSIAHSRTTNLSEITRQADILVVAAGRENLVSGDDIKEGAVVIDVGMNRSAKGKLVGDVHFESAKEKASYITPIPGGVGPMTITMLLANTLQSAKKRSL
ncbi:bifunctional methylenetetrahydrofolate dehydrogenase/methenyltetrahydrofolate cyclohydrolase FolD [Pullulanibacillus sp. KACC 23026]|uniref:bifunctional methylenetetrahydrofolate dehydrogenase/methenyltetrahydrofolate cyclohydrolase FolD n=1 Tax=Pullulanibacillus sp. KACC 23026 TaxID=3028315 RepID=UPI0023AF93D4|nr:bifunctional methylenetetrahydrofolate dehydrogenase/methenyltetrahydrofolate cyclohydrolase FolD [Pullulanibacillus sp. KACC 23026]WEG14318.1 bifunctional methylenetetrahydrofolate dehydrogenase/methenyltetrahydrofolate cyclohydrolase FolD [Pullulanibacillus sp. KACC 23026]